MAFMKSMKRTYFALIFFFFFHSWGMQLCPILFFSHPSLDVARLGPTLPITRSEQNLLYLLG